jgi:murein DD-endopeptidase MepM/ murein hydrolase activator NlpD
MALRRIDEGVALPLQRRDAVWWSDPRGMSRVNRSTRALSARTYRWCQRRVESGTVLPPVKRKPAITQPAGSPSPRLMTITFRGEARVRQRNVSSPLERMNAMRWLFGAVALTVSLILALSPLILAPTAAAPPEAIRETLESSDITPDSGTETEKPPEAETPRVPDTQDQLVSDVAPRDDDRGVDGSVRLRGVEAPVQLEQQEGQGADRPRENTISADKQKNDERDPGDGPVQKQREPAKKRKPERPQPDIRIWPMPAESYTFTQEFGCVPQLGNLYFPGEGCPASRPVIHTGIDLAAPEGTPFYAAASGWVTLADYDRPTADANTRIIIQHDGRNEGYATDYLHWVASYVDEGDYVHAGDPIGEVGNVGFSTGPHLHFSVTDLDTGEHIDPLRWLPDEPGLEGYVSRMPKARLRLPPGTTAGQPESADPAPPPPAVREEVPESPPENGKRGGKSERRGTPKRDERAAASEDPTANDAKRSGKKKSRDSAASDSTTTDGSTSDATKDRNRPGGRKRTREPNTADTPQEDATGVREGRNADSSEKSGKGDRRGNRESTNDASGGGKEKGTPDRGGRPARDTPKQEEPNKKDPSSGRDGGGGKARDKGAKSETETEATASGSPSD